MEVQCDGWKVNEIPRNRDYRYPDCTYQDHSFDPDDNTLTIYYETRAERSSDYRFWLS